MSLTFSNADEIVIFASKQKLYNLLLIQLEKDFNFSGVDFKIRKNCSPQHLIASLEKELKCLILYDFAAYLNLLYRIDVSEAAIKKTDGSNLDILVNQVCFLILKREWQKVWIRSKTAN